MNELDFTSILNAFSSPVLVARPVRSGSAITDFEIVFTNDAFSQKVGYATEGCCYFHEFKERISSEVPWFDLAEKTINGIQTEPTTFRSPTSGLWFRMQMQKSKDDMAVITLEDVTSEKESHSKLSDTAFLDLLTGLPNRNKFNADFDGILSKAHFSATKLGLLIIDIDNLKSINDSKGHHAGDSILKTAANILNQFSSRSIASYRFEGDEFLVVIQNEASADSITNVTDTIFESFLREGISISGGIAVCPDNSESGEDLLRFTDIALCCAKKAGKNRFTFFEPDMQRVFIQRLNMQARMTSAVLSSSFSLFYQPQFDVQSGELRGFEALIRWHDKDLGNISPELFIPLAEETGLIIPIGTWVLNTAFTTLKKWQTRYQFTGVLSINISPLQLKQPEFVFDIEELARKYEIDPGTVEIEITEGIMIDNMEEAGAKLSALKDIGFRISLDDFGTGYSSLSYLQALPLSTLKIDKSFINNITSTDGIQANITNSIITMVSKMGLDTIAEGVEKPDQLELLKKFNCNIVQGFLRGKPMPEKNCDAYLGGEQSALLSIERENLA